jgi:hypothetical protein
VVAEVNAREIPAEGDLAADGGREQMGRVAADIAEERLVIDGAR